MTELQRILSENRRQLDDIDLAQRVRIGEHLTLVGAPPCPAKLAEEESAPLAKVLQFRQRHA